MYVIQVPNMNLDQIYLTGQSPRWIKLRDGKYIIPFRDKAVKIEQKKERFMLNCNDEDFYNIWWNYFDLSFDYMDLNHKVRQADSDDKSLLYISANRASGVHLLKQDLWEVMVLSVLNTCCSNEAEYQYIIHELERVAGVKHTQAMREAGKVVWYEFPSPERLLGKLKNLTYGKELKPLCEDAVVGWIDFDLIPQMTYKEAGILLKSYGYFTNHQIKKICLYGCGKKYAAPFSKSIITPYLDEELGISYEDFEEWYLEGPLKTNQGIVQLYLVYNYKNPPGGITLWD